MAILDMNEHGTKPSNQREWTFTNFLDMDNRTVLNMNGHGSSKSHPKAKKSNLKLTVEVNGWSAL